MSEMSYLEKLLDGVEVEWRNLGDTSLFEIANNGRKPVKASLRIAGETPYYGANNIQDYVDGYTHDGEYVLIAEDGSASLENYSIQYATGKFWANNHVHVVRGKERVHSRFLYHYLCIVNFLPFLTGGGRAKLTKGQLIEIPVPIPCPDNPEKSLAIQSEIVRILDKFTALTAELTAELNMRKKQYNYYRDQLLSFKEGEVEWKTLEEVLVDKFWIMPATPKFDDNGEIPYVTSKNISGGNIDFERVKHISRDDFLRISKNRPILKGDFLISMIGTIGEIARVKCLDPDFYGQNMYLIRLNEELLHPRYFLHFFDSPRMKFYFKSVKNNSGQGYLKANNIDGLSIPLPSIDEQQKIAFILDKFDTLTNSINEGLPREIELRQKQYEYYRDLLFSFPKPDTVNQ
ncbi:restriction endonuclease subunit S [Escherichia coli]|uniref:Restriction endonuclease subunit S n=1 Tax=Escherichia coli TaxID=562 RepID=A0A8T5YEK5_ECOLX|nr:restriction endonuclease subunit S [Escherichia coli]MGT75904.1 restriction endonuclease subunit S [Escherichia coli]MVW15045.1 restriction endonuclease subunit S [Escherichia coli]MWK98762.1 restriction endonuclease subunit S [Escherichia coli]